MERVTLEAPIGMLYTNGVVYGSVIHLAEGMDSSEFHLITREEYDEMLVAEIEDDENV